ncbi:MAG: septum site-determining protein Ssd [Candidatus Nanopelagicales bacterium]
MTNQPDERPLLATDDVELIDDVLRLAAAAGVEPVVVNTVAALRSRWSRHCLVVVGWDLADELTQDYVPRRDSVVLATRGSADPAAGWRAAAHLGADQVAVLPQAESWLIDRFAGIGVRGRAPAPVVAIVGGCGGAGASSLAVGVAVTAVERGQSVTAIDLDPLGTGIELMLGQDHPTGLAWSDLANTRGRLRGDAVRSSLPDVAGVRVLGWGNVAPQDLAPGSAGSAVDGLARSCDLVVVDLPRSLGETSAEVLCRCTLVVLACPRTSAAVAAASRMLSLGELRNQPVQLATRGPSPAGISAQDVVETLDLPLLCDVAADPGVARRVERGSVPIGRRGGLRIASNAVLRELAIPVVPHQAERMTQLGGASGFGGAA